MIALLVANLTADNLIGMSGLSQVALWSAVLIRAGHIGIEEATRLGRAGVGGADA